MYNKIEWEDVCDDLEEILSFIGWDNKMKLLWVEKAWSCVNSAGLTSYTTDLEMHIVYIRLYTILEFYCEFISLVMDSEDTLEGDELVSQFKLNPFRLGQLIDLSFEPEEEDECLLLANAMDELASQYREEVLQVLIKGFDSVATLFTSLWLTHDISFLADDYMTEEDDFMDVTSLAEGFNLEEYDKIINAYQDMTMNSDLNSNKLRAYEWLEKQC